MDTPYEKLLENLARAEVNFIVVGRVAVASRLFTLHFGFMASPSIGTKSTGRMALSFN